MVAWSIAMAVVLVAWELRPAHEAETYLWGAIVTAAFGVYLGWRRRSSAVFLAPLVSWCFAWLPLWIAAMVRHGVIKGIFVGLVLVTVGWLVIGAFEFLSLGAVALLVRTLRGGRPHVGEDEVIIMGPHDVR